MPVKDTRETAARRLFRFVTSEQERFLSWLCRRIPIRSESLYSVSVHIIDPYIVSLPTVETSTCSAEFESLDRLLKSLHSAVPGFDESTLSIRKDTPETYVAFAGEMELDDSQLLLLGLKDGPRS